MGGLRLGFVVRYASRPVTAFLDQLADTTECRITHTSVRCDISATLCSTRKVGLS